MPDLSTLEGQEEINATLVRPDTKLIIVDNLSTLCRTGKENDSESWTLIQQWALTHRAAGRSILFIHHSGKGGGQRGTSRREDVLDTVIQLRHPPNYDPEDGARFEVNFEKSRGFHGSDAESVEAKLETTPDGLRSWSHERKKMKTKERVKELFLAGLKQHEIVEELKINKSGVSKHIKNLKNSGEL